MSDILPCSYSERSERPHTCTRQQLSYHYQPESREAKRSMVKLMVTHQPAEAKKRNTSSRSELCSITLCEQPVCPAT
jgi:hypothetical protein